MLNNTDLQITVIGAGHGGKAMAADLAVHGYSVRLYNRTYQNIEVIAAAAGSKSSWKTGSSSSARSAW